MSPLAERLLDDFLRLADAHGSFRQALVALAAHQAETRAALRRGDPGRLASAARAQRRAGRDLPRLAAAARAVAARAPAPLPEDLQPETAALGAAIADSTVAVASASAAVFSGVSSLSNAAAAARVEVASTPCWVTAPSRFTSSSDAPRTSHQRVWWVADLVRWMSRAKRRSAGKTEQRQGRRRVHLVHGAAPARGADEAGGAGPQGGIRAPRQPGAVHRQRRRQRREGVPGPDQHQSLLAQHPQPNLLISHHQLRTSDRNLGNVLLRFSGSGQDLYIVLLLLVAYCAPGSQPYLHLSAQIWKPTWRYGLRNLQSWPCS
ncbi:hypothetical protein D1007_30915 [Hordeum vulgare]|nr:hypothetical protein D1007_30915 [Hordeum vulgare]